jgi:hypothetical protein
MIAAQPYQTYHEVDEQDYDNSYLNQPEPPTYPGWLLLQARAWLWWQEVAGGVRWALGISTVALVVWLAWRVGVFHTAATQPTETHQNTPAIVAPGCYRGISISWLEDGQERPFVVATLPKRGC